MRLLSEQQAPPAASLGQFRQGRFGVLFFAVFMLAATGFLVWFAMETQATWFVLSIAGLTGLITLLILGAARAALRESNWTVRCASDGIYIKVRSYMNWHFSPLDPVIVFVPYREIESAQLRRGNLVVPGSEEQTVQELRTVDLEIRLREKETQALCETIEAEKTRVPQGRIRSWSPHRPVEVTEPGVIVIHWRNAHSHLAPKIESFLHATRGKFALEKETVSPTIDFRHMSDAELEAFALKLARAGQKLEAMSMLHQKFGGTLTEAKQRLERIGGKAP